MEWLYERTEDNSARFILGTVGANPLVCFGINPSTAVPNNLDPTLKRVSKYAEKNGFDSWIMLNIYPQRATDPNEMHIEMDDALHQKNINYITSILARQKTMLWAAWGENIRIRGYLIECLRNINKVAIRYGCRWVALGKTDNMHPYHPLYRGKGFRLYSSPLLDFDISNYTT